MSLGPDSVVLVREGENVSREQFRAERVAEIPESYSPALHLGFPSLFGIAAIAASIALLRDVTALDLWFVPLVYMASNATEWRAHKHVLHHRTKPLELLYDRHTPVHHRIYMTDDMAIRSAREFRLVLIPPYAIVAILVGLAPMATALWLFGQHNLACLFIATTMFYVLSYEWLHLAYHQPSTSFIGRLWLIRKLRRHHALHHDPRLMQRWNFNVTVPLWDWVRGTVYRAAD
jgi:hypothetical protein